MVHCNKQNSRGNLFECKTFLLRRNKTAFVTFGRQRDAALRSIAWNPLRSGTLGNATLSLRRIAPAKEPDHVDTCRGAEGQQLL